jgi:tRNA uridine 5-carboxymethylaminomethyl modification enzyme
MFTYPKKYNVVVIGAGHAGCEAALASARMPASSAGKTCQVLLLTMNIDTVAHMSCNPAIGGLAKGQIVREIDALGGEMAKNTDKTAIQFRMLNRSKGPAVQSPRAQCDRKLYQLTMKQTIEKQENLDLRQGEAIKILTKSNRVSGILTKTGTVYETDAVIVTTGTFLKGLVHLGLKNYPAGRSGEFPAEYLSDSLRELGFEVGRLKTGTPPRINGRTLDYSKLARQDGDSPPVFFSLYTLHLTRPQIPCWLTYTNEKTHRVIRENLDRSPLYTGIIKSIGPRYCPSIEDKVVRFPDKERHQVFLEPEGINTEEMYCNGISTSLPEDVQEGIVHSLTGCEKAEIMRYGYAIEYDFAPPTQLKPTLETKQVENLYFAGQINGTTGYEEAAGQGLIAGINAVLKLRGKEPFILGRDEAYIGVLIDDLVTKGIMDPYRMFTSRAEYRLILRNDNADLRLLPYGYKFGLIPKEIYEKFLCYEEKIDKEIAYLEKTFVPVEGVSLAHLIRRGLTYNQAVNTLHVTPYTLHEDISPWSEEKIREEVEIEIKYEGYIKRQNQEVEKFKKLERKLIPEDFDYDAVPGLLTESRLKLKKIHPRSIGQASRISGVTPADISILLVYLERFTYESKRELSKT